MTKLTLRCAIYTRKSSEEGLEQGFNSLDAQREACEAFVLSQQHEGWKLAPTFYDDGGYSGGNMERPALKQLLADIDQKKINVVVVYKVDRLTRSLADFAKIVEQFDAKGISFVSVTQQFNTTSSMGRLTLNVLLSFAQFEREVTGERIRDKIAASKAKGMWMGGTPPIGYKACERTLAIDEEGAGKVRHIYERYLLLSNVRLLTEELARQAIKTPLRISLTEQIHGGKPFWRGQIYRILTNPVYIGQIVHHDKVYEGDHPPIITLEQWHQVQKCIAHNRQGHRVRQSAPSDSLLVGLILDEQGHRLIASHSQKYSKRYRYYISETLNTSIRSDALTGIRIPAPELEMLVIQEIASWLGDESTVLTYLDPPAHQVQELTRAIHNHYELLKQDGVERYQFMHQLIDRVCVLPNQVHITIKPNVLLKSLAIPAEPLTLIAHTQIERCGMAMRLLVGNKRVNPTLDTNLIQTIRNGQDWLERLTSGKAKSLGELASQLGLTTTAVTNMVYRAFLAPDSIRAIMNGTQPAHLTGDFLKRQGPLPLDWEEQRQLLGLK